ncbi:MAG: cytochrome biosis protein [Proteobacteria bacterium]|nr:cytochrome biosis protein [Pseudomonadota bacterium]RPJ48497.1 MAG: cytochrome C biogenesis protein [Betaproteobacteria bacterium]
MQGILPYLISALLYAALSTYFWRLHWSGAAVAPVVSQTRCTMERVVILVALGMHAAVLFGTMLAGNVLRIGVGDAISAILWLTVLIYWLGSLFYRLDGLHALIMPVAAIAAFLPALLPAARPVPNTELLAFKLHLLISMLAYSLFTIASLHVLLMAMLERRLHQGALPAGLQKLPPLLTMETLLFRIIWAGFIMLTLTLLSGVMYSEELFGKAARINHKTIFGIVSWIVFGALLFGRHFHGWRGRVAVRWTLAGFLLLVLAYLGSKFVVEVLLGRG